MDKPIVFFKNLSYSRFVKRFDKASFEGYSFKRCSLINSKLRWFIMNNLYVFKSTISNTTINTAQFHNLFLENTSIVNVSFNKCRLSGEFIIKNSLIKAVFNECTFDEQIYLTLLENPLVEINKENCRLLLKREKIVEGQTNVPFTVSLCVKDYKGKE